MSESLIVHWPAGIRARGEVRGQYVHVVDIAPTVLDALGVTPPAELDGVAQRPLEGVASPTRWTMPPRRRGSRPSTTR